MRWINHYMGVAALTVIAWGVPQITRADDYHNTVLNTPNLLGYWPFSTTSGTNSVVNGYTGTFAGNAAFGAAGSGPVLGGDPNNRPVALDGTSGTFVNTSLVGGINTGGTIIAWFNLAQLPSVAGRIFDIAGQSQNGNDFDLGILNDNSIRFYSSSANYVASSYTVTAADLGKWHFVVGTFTANGTASLYLDGGAPDTNATGAHSPGTGTFAIGESDVFTGRQFNGAIDEVAVFDRELTGSEVAGIYASRLTAVPEPSTVALIASSSLGVIAFGHRRLKRRFRRMAR